MNHALPPPPPPPFTYEANHEDNQIDLVSLLRFLAFKRASFMNSEEKLRKKETILIVEFSHCNRQCRNG